jgi:DNA-binding MarR family transcriptional regulator
VTQLIQQISRLDRMIHEPARLTIMLILGGVGEADFLYLQREGGFTQGNLSGHLARLEEAGYIAIEKTFRGKVPLTVCSLTGKGKAALSKYSRDMLEALQSNVSSGNPESQPRGKRPHQRLAVRRRLAIGLCGFARAAGRITNPLQVNNLPQAI